MSHSKASFFWTGCDPDGIPAKPHHSNMTGQALSTAIGCARTTVHGIHQPDIYVSRRAASQRHHRGSCITPVCIKLQKIVATNKRYQQMVTLQMTFCQQNWKFQKESDQLLIFLKYVTFTTHTDIFFAPPAGPPHSDITRMPASASDVVESAMFMMSIMRLAQQPLNVRVPLFMAHTALRSYAIHKITFCTFHAGPHHSDITWFPASASESVRAAPRFPA